MSAASRSQQDSRS